MTVPRPGVYDPLGRVREGSDGPVNIAVSGGDLRGVSRAKPRGRVADSVEQRLQIEGRAADDLEHVARRGLVFERFLELAGALAQFAEQPGIVHRNDCLGREVFQERDFLSAERPHLAAAAGDHAEQCPVLRSANARLVRKPRSAAARACGFSTKRSSAV
jgi:hypothetical protein